MFTHEQVWHGIDRLGSRARPHGVGPCPARRPRPDHFQSQQTGYQAAQAALAEYREFGQDPERDRNLARRFRRAHGRSPARLHGGPFAPSALHRHGPGGPARAVRRSRLPGRAPAGTRSISQIWKTLTPMRSRSGVTTSCRRIAMVTSWSFRRQPGSAAGIGSCCRPKLERSWPATSAAPHRAAHRDRVLGCRSGVAGAAGPRSGVAGANRLGLAVRSTAIGAARTPAAVRAR